MRRSLSASIDDLVKANHILANEGVLDAYGHVSIRHPLHQDRFLISVSRSPELVEREDIEAYAFDGTPVAPSARSPYLERFIHGGIYSARPDVQAIVHSHADDVIPFSITDVPLRPVLHLASDVGPKVPVWDMADRFGDTTNLVTDFAQGRDLAAALADARAVLMRGHGFTVAGRSLFEAVRLAIYLPRNARVLMDALRMSPTVRAFSEGEIRVRERMDPDGAPARRAWEYWCAKLESRNCGCGRHRESPGDDGPSGASPMP